MLCCDPPGEGCARRRPNSSASHPRVRVGPAAGEVRAFPVPPCVQDPPGACEHASEHHVKPDTNVRSIRAGPGKISRLGASDVARRAGASAPARRAARAAPPPRSRRAARPAPASRRVGPASRRPGSDVDVDRPAPLRPDADEPSRFGLGHRRVAARDVCGACVEVLRLRRPPYLVVALWSSERADEPQRPAAGVRAKPFEVPSEVPGMLAVDHRRVAELRPAEVRGGTVCCHGA